MGKIQLVMTKIGCRYRQDKRYQEGYYDCSSLVQRLYKEAGIDLPVTAAAPGDLIFYSYEENGEFCNISHVAIYVEMVKEVIESEVDTDDVE